MRTYSTRLAVRRSVVAAAVAVTLAVAGCSNDDAGGNQDGTVPGEQTMATAGPATGMSPPDQSGSAMSSVEPTGSQGTAGSTDSGGQTSSEAMTSEPSFMQTSTTGESASTSATTSTDVNGVDLATQQFDLSWKDALERARQQFDGDVTKVELEVEGKVYGYKIELMSDTQKFDYQIDANTGDVLEQETGDLDKSEVKTERQNKSIDLDKVISVEEAMKAALGEQNGRVKEWKIEGKSTGPRYEFDIEKPGSTSDVEVKIDAVSGKVIHTP